MNIIHATVTSMIKIQFTQYSEHKIDVHFQYYKKYQFILFERDAQEKLSCALRSFTS